MLVSVSDYLVFSCWRTLSVMWAVAGWFACPVVCCAVPCGVFGWLWAVGHQQSMLCCLSSAVSNKNSTSREVTRPARKYRYILYSARCYGLLTGWVVCSLSAADRLLVSCSERYRSGSLRLSKMACSSCWLELLLVRSDDADPSTPAAACCCCLGAT